MHISIAAGVTGSRLSQAGNGVAGANQYNYNFASAESVVRQSRIS